MTVFLPAIMGKGRAWREIQNLYMRFVILKVRSYSGVSNSCRPMFISGKVCLLASIKVKRQILPEINVGLQLLDTPEYVLLRYSMFALIMGMTNLAQ